MIRACLYLGPAAALAGVILSTVTAPRASRADDYETPRTHQMWVCKTTVSCAPKGRPKNATACDLDAAAETIVLPKGARVMCQRIVK